MENIPSSTLIEWIVYRTMKEQREQQALIDALLLVATRLFGKEEN